MKKNLLLFISLLLLQSGLVLGQSQSKGNWCGFDQRLQSQLKDNPALQKEFEQWRENVQNTVQKMELEKSPAGVIQIIPVVVHVIHDNGVGNISEAQVRDGIRVLNEDFVRMNEDSVQTRSVFKPYAGVADFEFRLAKIDPNGNPTNGIVRVNSTLTYEADDNTKSVSYWNSSKYFNIWLVNTISGSTQTSIILGYAQFPGWGAWNKYGVIMLHSQFGRIGTSSEGRTATHEVGHCLNLFHTFEGGCGGSNCSSNGDDVCDTPPTANSTQGCSLTQNLCSNDAGGSSPYTTDVEDQIENYMSYDDCQNMFTSGQIVRMKAAIANNTPLQNLISVSNLTATGVNSLYAADFDVTKKVICVNQTVKFSDFSYYGQNGWSWVFPGGAPFTSSVQNPEVTYYTPGLYDVSLTTTDGSTTKTKAASNYVLVVSDQGNYLPFTEGFESGTVPNNKWYVNNPDNDANTFQQITGTGYSGNACIKLDNTGNSISNKDELIAGAFDFSNMTAVTVSFKAAYAQKDTSTKDKLMVYASGDCGTTWVPRYAKVGSALASAANQTSPFTPTDTTQWKNHSASLTASLLKENVLIKFVFESDEGNNFYLDDINITGTYNKVPVLKYPANNAVGQSDNVKIDWNSVGGITMYQHQLDTTINFNSPLLDPDQHNFISNDPYGTDTEHQYSGLLHGQKYYWRARTITGTDTSAWSAIWNFTVSGNGVGENELQISDYRMQVYPNPVAGSSVILLSLNNATVVSLEVYDIMGRRASVISNEKKFEKGEYQFNISKNEFLSGLYLLKLTVDDKTSFQKFVVE